jgi:hypothetical protein
MFPILHNLEIGGHAGQFDGSAVLQFVPLPPKGDVVLDCVREDDGFLFDVGDGARDVQFA